MSSVNLERNSVRVYSETKMSTRARGMEVRGKMAG